MTKSVWEKTSEAFAEGGGARQYGGDYLTELRNNWRDNENGITRASGLIVGLAALFEFVILKKAKGDTLWGVPLSGSDVVKFALPVIVALSRAKTRTLALSWCFCAHQAALRYSLIG